MANPIRHQDHSSTSLALVSAKSMVQSHIKNNGNSVLMAQINKLFNLSEFRRIYQSHMKKVLYPSFHCLQIPLQHQFNRIYLQI
jgi:hypothetical protein